MRRNKILSPCAPDNSCIGFYCFLGALGTGRLRKAPYCPSPASFSPVWSNSVSSSTVELSSIPQHSDLADEEQQSRWPEQQLKPTAAGSGKDFFQNVFQGSINGTPHQRDQCRQPPLYWCLERVKKSFSHGEKTFVCLCSSKLCLLGQRPTAFPESFMKHQYLANVERGAECSQQKL